MYDTIRNTFRTSVWRGGLTSVWRGGGGGGVLTSVWRGGGSFDICLEGGGEF